jgi:hypothetical protein
MLMGTPLDWRTPCHLSIHIYSHWVRIYSNYAQCGLTSPWMEHSLELVVWLVPSLIGDAVAVSLIGMLLGPIYPIVMNHAGKILPHWLLTGSIGWIAGFGQAGSAFLPFLTGVIASKAGIWALQPL